MKNHVTNPALEATIQRLDQELEAALAWFTDLIRKGGDDRHQTENVLRAAVRGDTERFQAKLNEGKKP